MIRYFFSEKKMVLFHCDLFFSVCCLYSFHFVSLFIEKILAGRIFPSDQLSSWGIAKCGVSVTGDCTGAPKQMCCVVSRTLADSLPGYSSCREVLGRSGTSLPAQWLRIHLTVQGMWVQSRTPGTEIPHTPGQLSPRTTTAEPALCKREATAKEPTHHRGRVAPARRSQRRAPQRWRPRATTTKYIHK